MYISNDITPNKVNTFELYFILKFKIIKLNTNKIVIILCVITFSLKNNKCPDSNKNTVINKCISLFLKIFVTTQAS